MTDHETARTDIRRRQREVADRVLAANGTNGATRAEVNEALDADGAAEPNTILGAGLITLWRHE